MNFLTFRIVAAMGSWGKPSVGINSRRIETETYPTKSAVVGMVGQCLGYQLGSPEFQRLDAEIKFASLTPKQGVLLEDYHTVSSNGRPKKGDFSNRREELFGHTKADEIEAAREGKLLAGKNNTSITRREYLMGIETYICLYYDEGVNPGVTLEQIQQGLQCPQAAPFVGRRSCPLSVDFRPTVAATANPVTALQTYLDRTGVKARVGFEGSWAGVIPERTEYRRDQASNREAWLFHVRPEHVLNIGASSV